MKALLIKDFKLMKNNIRYIIIGGIILGIVFYLNKTGDFIVGGGFLIAYMSFIGMITSLRTIANDHNNSSSSYLFTLPVSRRTYTLEKYIFSFLIGIICFLISILIVIIICIFKNEIDLKVTLYTALAVFAIMIFMTDIMIPIQLKYGTLISRIALIIIIFSVLAIVLSLAYGVVENKITISPFFANMTYSQLLLYLYLFAIITTIISYKISEHIMNHKEFY